MKEVTSLYEMLQGLQNRQDSLLPNGFGNLWLGNIVYLLGGDPEVSSCRGEVYAYSLKEDVLTIETQEAWCVQEGFMQAIQKAYPKLRVYYISEEEGGYCLTNDRDRVFFKDRYLLDGSPDLHEFFGSLTDLIQFVEKRVGHPVGASLADVEEALEAYCETHEEEDCWFAVCEVEVVE